MRYRVWWNDGYSWVSETDKTYRWRWMARLVAWERQSRGWFRYRVTADDQ